MTEFWLNFDLHIDWILTAYCLHFDCILAAFCLQFDSILAAFWLYFDWILNESWLLAASFWLNFNCILAVFWLHFTKLSYLGHWISPILYILQLQINLIALENWPTNYLLFKAVWFILICKSWSDTTFFICQTLIWSTLISLFRSFQGFSMYIWECVSLRTKTEL